MAWVTWRPVKIQTCDRVDEEVALEVQFVYPVDFLSSQPPRVIGHRCSRGLDCNLVDKPACLWTGTLPGYDPFR